MRRSFKWLALLSVSLVGCAARGGSVAVSADESLAEVRNLTVASVAEYASIAAFEDLESLVERDIAARDFERLQHGLEAFVRASILGGREMRAHLMFAKLRPVWRLQGAGGARYVAAIQEQQRILELAGREELDRAHAALERGDWDRLRRMRADPRSVLGAESLEMSSELSPHVSLADAMLRFDALRSASVRDPREAREVASVLDALAPALERDGYGSMSFLARIGAAEALDLAGLEAEAIERWLALLDSRYLASADESVQVAIAVRLKGYTDRLREDLTRRIQAEGKALADARVREVETRYASLSQEQLARVRDLEDEVARVRGATQIEIRDNLETQRVLFSGTLEQQQQRIRELERLFAEIALTRNSNVAQDSVALDDTIKAVGVLADVVTVWNAANRERAVR